MISALAYDRDRDVFVVNSDDVHSHFTWINYILDPSKFKILRLILPNSRPFLITGKKTRSAQLFHLDDDYNDKLGQQRVWRSHIDSAGNLIE